MKSFSNFSKDYCFESVTLLDEALITLGKKAYPKFNNVLIMAGGAGSGKGFVLQNLIGLEGKTFDVDALKAMALRAKNVQKRVKKEIGVDLSSMDLKNPEDVSKLHDIMTNVGIKDRQQKAAFRSILSSEKDRKPNLIFDVTLKSLSKLKTLTDNAKRLGYKSENIHIVWVVNDVEIAKQQNRGRERVVHTEILVNTHRGVSNTMNDIINMGSTLKRYLDGDIVFAFNKIGVDSSVMISGRGGMYIKKSNYFYVKRQGQRVRGEKELTKEVRAKIAKYTPNNVDW